MTIEYRYSIKTEQDTHHRVPVLEEQKSSSCSDRTSAAAYRPEDIGLLDAFTYSMKLDHRVSELDENRPGETYIIESRYAKSKSHRVLATGHQRQLQMLTDLTDLRTR